MTEDFARLRGSKRHDDVCDNKSALLANFHKQWFCGVAKEVAIDVAQSNGFELRPWNNSVPD